MNIPPLRATVFTSRQLTSTATSPSPSSRPSWTTSLSKSGHEAPNSAKFPHMAAPADVRTCDNVAHNLVKKPSPPPGRSHLLPALPHLPRHVHRLDHTHQHLPHRLNRPPRITRLLETRLLYHPPVTTTLLNLIPRMITNSATLDVTNHNVLIPHACIPLFTHNLLSPIINKIMDRTINSARTRLPNAPTRVANGPFLVTHVTSARPLALIHKIAISHLTTEHAQIPRVLVNFNGKDVTSR
jgi:hypothetical protein